MAPSSTLRPLYSPGDILLMTPPTITSLTCALSFLVPRPAHPHPVLRGAPSGLTQCPQSEGASALLPVTFRPHRWVLPGLGHDSPWG